MQRKLTSVSNNSPLSPLKKQVDIQVEELSPAKALKITEENSDGFRRQNLKLPESTPKPPTKLRFKSEPQPKSVVI